MLTFAKAKELCGSRNTGKSHAQIFCGTCTSLCSNTHACLCCDIREGMKRFCAQGASMAIEVPLPHPGTYAVQLFFSELYFSAAGQRMFDVDIADLPALNCFDVFQSAGGYDHGIIITVMVEPTDKHSMP